MDLRNQQIKETYGNLATINTVAGTPTTGVLQNGAGSNVTALTLEGDLTIADKIIHSGDTNTAIRFPAADTVAVETAGSERLRIDSSGNVGMNAIPENSSGSWRNYQLGSLSMAGRSSNALPDAMFGTNFKFTTANAEQRISAHATSRVFFNDDVITFQNAGSSTADSVISWNDRMRIDSNGVLSVGTTTTAFGLRTTSTLTGMAYTPTDYLCVAADTYGLAINRISTDGEAITFHRDGTQAGSIGVITGVAYFAGPSGANHGIKPYSTGIAPVNNAGTLLDNTTNLGASSARFKDLYLGGSVYLGGTSAANALDDYEEGTWTPSIVGSSTAGTYEIATSQCFYTKIGNTVHLDASIVLDNPITGGGSGVLIIEETPFAKKAGYLPVGSARTVGVDLDATADRGLYSSFASGSNPDDRILIAQNNDDASPVAIPISAVSAGDNIIISITYKV